MTSLLQVLEAMPQGGLPYTPKTAYIVIRGAVNSGRQELAEMYAARMMVRASFVMELVVFLVCHASCKLNDRACATHALSRVARTMYVRCINGNLAGKSPNIRSETVYTGMYGSGQLHMCVCVLPQSHRKGTARVLSGLVGVFDCRCKRGDLSRFHNACNP